MQERYFQEGYEFIPPYRSKFWCRCLEPFARGRFRKGFNLQRWEFHGQEHLLESISQGAGILLTANHSRLADVPALSLLGLETRQFLYFVASYHLFKQGRKDRWLLNRLGG
ncbi:MAG: hypothetical protein N2C14_27045, partial [Planctomycetales bacterium]